MHGFQNLEDFGGLKESHLNELNITDPEQCAKIMKVTELLLECKYMSKVKIQKYLNVLIHTNNQIFFIFFSGGRIGGRGEKN